MPNKRKIKDSHFGKMNFKNTKIKFYGGNQPTGLGISNNGNYLCFSNFKDDNIEIYWIKDFDNE